MELFLSHVLSVSQITSDISELLEDNFSNLWIRGEVSNLKISSAGHAYFTLKDESSQISCVIFKGQFYKMRLDLKDGLDLMVHGRLTVYEQRGQYQILVDQAEPAGLGALRLAYEQRFAKLKASGLFDESRKRPLPFLPKCIGIATSPQGSVIHDMLHVIKRRFPSIRIVIYPVRVQGQGAYKDSIEALEYFNEILHPDVIVLARGGGSLEDLWNYNEEELVHAIASSKIPVVSAIGHETDVTLCDLVADKRAPTPSAGAELMVPVYSELAQRLDEFTERLYFDIQETLHRRKTLLKLITRNLKNPIEVSRLRRDKLKYLKLQLQQMISDKMASRQHRLALIQNRIRHHPPRFQVALQRCRNLHKLMQTHQLNRMQKSLFDYQNILIQLKSLSPQKILSRGYAYVTRPDGHVVSGVRDLKPMDNLKITFADGWAHTEVKKVESL